MKVRLGRSVNLTTLFLGRLKPIKRLTSTQCTFFRNWQLPFMNQWKGENDRRKDFMINLNKRMLPDREPWTHALLITSPARIRLSYRAQLLNQWKGENDCRQDFMINLNKRMVPDTSIEPSTCWGLHNRGRLCLYMDIRKIILVYRSYLGAMEHLEAM